MATIAALLAGVALPPGLAAAAVAADASSTAKVTIGIWSVVATQSTATSPPAGALSLPVPNTTPAYFRLVNTGTVTVTGVTYAVTVTSTNQNSNVTMTACSQPWTAGGTCPATSSVVATWSAKSTPPSGQVASGAAIASSLAPASPAGIVYVQAVAANVPRAGLTATVNMSVSSSSPRQIRPATVTDG